jgi:hypothetical protein
MVVSSYHFLFGPLVALGALGVICLICRWVFSTTDRDERAARRREAAEISAQSRGDFGLLVPVTTVRSVDDAEMLQTVLRGAGIRATVAADPSGTGWSVLVFGADAPRASALVRS